MKRFRVHLFGKVECEFMAHEALVGADGTLTIRRTGEVIGFFSSGSWLGVLSGEV